MSGGRKKVWGMENDLGLRYADGDEFEDILGHQERDVMKHCSVVI